MASGGNQRQVVRGAMNFVTEQRLPRKFTAVPSSSVGTSRRNCSCVLRAVGARRGWNLLAITPELAGGKAGAVGTVGNALPYSFNNSDEIHGNK